MWGHYHPIPYQSKIKEKFISIAGIGLSFTQAAWWAVGGYLSVQMSKVVPRLGTDWLYSRVHYFIPFLICMYFCYSKHPATNLPVWKYYFYVLRLRLKKRKFLYKKGGS